MMIRRHMMGAAAALACGASFLPRTAQAEAADQRIATLEMELATLRQTASVAQVVNLFSRYMYLHNAFRDTDIIPLWARKGTPDVRAQYSNLGVYTDWDKIISYHQGRPAPRGKLIMRYVATPIIEVAGEPYSMGWIPFAAAAQDGAFNVDLMYVGEDGKPVFMPPVDGRATVMGNMHRTDTSQRLEARPPEPYRTFSETFAY